MRVTSILKLRKTVLLEKGEVFKVQVLISLGGMESGGKNTCCTEKLHFWKHEIVLGFLRRKVNDFHGMEIK